MAIPGAVSFAMLLRPSAVLLRLVTKPRDCRSCTRRVVLLADSPVASARSAIRSSRFGASDRCMSIVYSLAVRPVDRTRSLSRWRGKVLTIRMSARHSASSDSLSGSALVIRRNRNLLLHAIEVPTVHLLANASISL